MAISTPLQSPGIFVREIDLTGVVPNVPTSTGAYAGNFRWGPVEEPVLVANETGLVTRFGAPDSSSTVAFHEAAYFLRYSNSLQVIRAVPDTGIYNAYDSDAYGSASDPIPLADGGKPLVKNRDNFDIQAATLANSTVDSASLKHTFIAKYPGELGNALEIHLAFGGDSDGGTQEDADSGFDTWTYKSYFDGPPQTSSNATDFGCAADEVHVVVIDKTGAFGVRGQVLEAFPYLSLAPNAVNADGSTNYIVNVINNASSYVWMAGFGQKGNSSTFATNSGTNFSVDDPTTYDSGRTAYTKSVRLANGADGGALDAGDYQTAFDEVEDKENILVDFLIAPGMNSRLDQTTIVNDLVAIAQSTRKDCVVVTSPARSDIINNSDPVGSTVSTAASFTQSSYLVMDNNYLKIYDKYNDQYINLAAASSVAGLMAGTDQVAAPWYSPAGPRRGQLLGITNIAYSPNQTERDTLYKVGVNPIANIPGQGVLLFGDKTKLARPSAFDRINVRRLFLAIERAIAIAARNVLFEFNDEFTRAEFKNIVEPFLREIQGRRGITDFRVVCDETNNTAAVIDRNEFVCSIFIKPARSINFVTLNFVAVRTGVDFEEVVGTV